MKKVLLMAVILLAASVGSFAQNYSGCYGSDDPAYVQGQSTVSVGYGVGNIWKKLFKINSTFYKGTYKVSSTGPFSLTYEYGVTDRISGGIAASYSEVKGAYTDPDNKDNNHVERLTNLSVIARGNYHFGISPKFDPYIGLGIGYYKFKYEETGIKDKIETQSVAVPGSIGYNGQIGAKYYFTPAFGVFAEVGYVVGGYGQAGLTIKL